MEAKRPEGLDHPIVPKVVRVLSLANVWLYQRTDGRLGGTWRAGSAFPRGVPVLLLTTVGRKTGRRRTAPLLYLRDGERYVVVASQAGSPRDPLWYLNVKQQPEVDVQVGALRLSMHACTATPEERAALWPRLVAHYADFARYQSWTDRVIPVVILERRGIDEAASAAGDAAAPQEPG